MKNISKAYKAFLPSLYQAHIVAKDIVRCRKNKGRSMTIALAGQGKSFIILTLALMELKFLSDINKDKTGTILIVCANPYLVKQYMYPFNDIVNDNYQIKIVNAQTLSYDEVKNVEVVIVDEVDEIIQNSMITVS
jgi:hypothetical protein